MNIQWCPFDTDDTQCLRLHIGKSYTDRKIYEHFHNHKILYMCIHFQVIKQTIFPYYTRCITQKYQYQTIQYQPEG